MNYEAKIYKQFHGYEGDDEPPLRVLYYDIENTPLLSYNWGIYEQNAIRVVKQWYILSFSYMWQGEKKPKTLTLADFPKTFKKDFRDDSALVEALWKLHSEADILIAHNGNRHDQRKANTRFIFHGLVPPSPYQQIDTLKIARQKFAFSSNRLDDLGDFLGVGRKRRIMPQTWEDCMNGDLKAFELMGRYNGQDVLLLERVYLKLRAWMPNHPYIGVSTLNRPSFASQEKLDCPRCGSKKLSSMGWRKTMASKFRRYRCMNCGGVVSSSIRHPVKKGLKAI